MCASSRSLTGRTAGSRRKPRRPGELALCHLVPLRRGSRFPVTAPEEAVPRIADLTRPCRAEGHGGWCSSKPQFLWPSCSVGGRRSLCCTFKCNVFECLLKNGIRFQGASQRACVWFIEASAQDRPRRSNSICRFSIHKSHLTPFFMRDMCGWGTYLISFYLNAA